MIPFFNVRTISKKITLFVTLLSSIIAVISNSALSSEFLRLHVKGEANGIIEIRLNHELAPLHVQRIIKLTEEGHYNGVAFHRVIDGFMAQTGDIKFGKIRNFESSLVGMGGSDYPNLLEEFSDLPFLRGTVGMARSRDPNSANSQFFIMFDSASHLDRKYTVIGRVVSGIDIVLAIKKGNPKNNGSVEEPDYIHLAEIFGR